MTVQVTTLANGLRVATDSMADAESVVTGVWVGVGTRHEPWEANGVAHLVEHMMFKGTKKRSSFALSSAIENKGGDMNAHTSREATVYYARVLPEDAELAVDIVADMVRHSVFAPKDLDRERQVVIQEIGRDLDSPEDLTFDLMHKLAMPKQKAGRSILGSAKVIANLPRTALTDYVGRYYVAENMVVVASGRVDHDAFVSMVEKRYADLPKGKKAPAEKTKVSHGAKLEPKTIEQVHFILGFAGPGYWNKKLYYPAQILSIILGGSATSRLFQKVREKRGLVYTISSSLFGLKDAGIFQIYAGTDPKRLRELVPVVCDELNAIQDKVTRGELSRAKAQVRADLLMGRESVMRRAEALGHQILAYGKPSSTEEILKKITGVTEDDVKEMAQKIFAHKPILTALGPLEELESYEKIASRLKR